MGRTRPGAHALVPALALALALAATIALSACASDPLPPTVSVAPTAATSPSQTGLASTSEAPPPGGGLVAVRPIDLERTTWRAIEVSGKPAVPGNEPTLTIGAGTVEGSDGCNVYTGPVALADGRWVPGVLNQSLMACPDPLMAQADAFVAVMREPGLIGFDSLGRLVIGEAERFVVFVPAAPLPVPPGTGG